ncbi:ATP-binding protein [Oceanobacillus jordanicus]|uniref:histidine kinase n=1 Tax=Oceanobacillus jordanicus TaxID=2867266 RepID=A0AAW5B8M1_9BACI|nr:ATP-binding protein [Oceanobacillus jordanicus]MCG3420954.1 response regulator [Oceanobacillus jordanicus]
MKKPSMILIIILFFLLVLTVFRLLWGSIYSTTHHPEAQEGVLDLRQGQLGEIQTTPVVGEWTFYPDVLLDQSALQQAQDGKTYNTFPNGWNNIPIGSTYTVGTYHLRILLPPSDTTTDYGLRMPVIQSATKLFIDGEEISGSGNPSVNPSDYIAQKVPYTVSFRSNKETIDVIVHVAHGNYPIRSSEVGVVKFGYASAINKETRFSVISQIIVLTVLGAVAIFIAFLYFVGKRPKSLLYFFLLLINAMLMVFLDVDKFLLKLIPITYESSVKMLFLVYTSIASFMLLFFKHFLPEYANKMLKWFLSAYLLYVGFILLAPVTYILSLRFLLGIVLLTTTCFITIQFFKAARNRMEDVLYLLLSAAAITNNVIWAIIYSNSTIERFFYPVDLLITIFLFSAFWLKRFLRNVHRIQGLSEELIQVDKRKDAFLANTSHELRNPLHSMINIAHSVLHSKENKLNQEDYQNMELLITVGKRMSSMINDLLDLGRIKENKVTLQLKPLPLQAVTAGVVDMLQHLLEDRPVQIQTDVQGDVQPVLADENRLIQILVNLLHNAIKYTDKGTITISTNYMDNKVVISVADTGIGMKEERIHSIFKPYEQGIEEDVDEVRGGVGLGLTISHQLVKLHGGEIEVHSALHKGSVFSFSLLLAKEEHSVVETPNLPVISHLEAAVSKAIETTHPILYSEAPKLLVVDDETINLRVLKNILASEQYEITTAVSGAEALEKLKTDTFHLLISDVMMPYMSGYELTKKVREQYTLSELPILLLTARNSSEDLSTGFASGANDYIVKPVDPLELRSRVDVLVKLKTSIAEHMRMEAAWLQAQIKPHFLFNTLNSIMYLMEIDQEKMRYVLDHFIQFIQTSFAFKNTETLVSLEEELALVHSYIEIEKVRFGDRVNIKWDVDARIKVQLPPLSIQTLVENAINHGILKQSEGGTVTISIKAYKGFTRISIMDDGVGMNSEQQVRLTKHNPRERKSVGIYNTDRRLRQLFGEGITIKSEQAKGTIVSFFVSNDQS